MKNLVWYQFLLFFTVKLQVLVELNLEWNASTLNDFFSFVSASGNIRQLYCLQGEYTTGDGLFVVCQRHTAHGKGAVAHGKVFNVCNTRCVVCRALGKHFAECQKRHSAKIFQKNKKTAAAAARLAVAAVARALAVVAVARARRRSLVRSSPPPQPARSPSSP